MRRRPGTKTRIGRVAVGLAVVLSACVASGVAAADGGGRARDAAAVERLAGEARSEPALAGATGTVNLVRISREATTPERRPGRPSTREEKDRRARSFLWRDGRAFGIDTPETELSLVRFTVPYVMRCGRVAAVS